MDPTRGREPSAIVGIGASAGGLETFTELLKALPVDTGMAFVLVQHLDPKHASILAELLVKATKMPVIEVKDGLPAEPDHVYVIPPNADMSVLHGRLHLFARPTRKHQLSMPIDYFFRALAQDQGSKAIGVVLSGTATDGSRGLKAVKSGGGITFAQDPGTAKYDGMPRAAISAGGVDFIMTPEGIAGELARIGRHPYMARAKETEPALQAEEGPLSKIFVLLRTATGVDFSYYKHATVMRRIARRMLVFRLEKLDDYVNYLREHPEEARALYDDMLITVTNFFRDPGVFDALAGKIFPKIVNEKTPDDPIRVWVAGCATGEEAYAAAISLIEFLEAQAINRPIQVFATDIHEKSIEKARRGVYPESISEDISSARLRRFFTRVEGGFQVNRLVRDMCVFAKHDVTKDPPFSRLDLICCRNVLIYLGPVLQKKVVSMFHWALNPTGFLLLGASETVGQFTSLFGVVDKKNKIYARKAAPARLPLDFAAPARQPAPEPPAAVAPSRSEPAARFDLSRDADRIVLERYAPAGVIVDDNLEIVQFRGHTGRYLEAASGKASLNLLDMARPGIQLDLRAAVFQARKTHAPVVKKRLRIKYNGKYSDVNIEVLPIVTPSGVNYCLVLFTEASTPPAAKAGPAQGPRTTPAPAGESELARLAKELVDTKEFSRAIIEERDATNEELRAANEELQSSTEELRSVNEELETAKEELQSSNEELTTVNEELQNRNFELTWLNDDLSNVLASVYMPILILANDLRIRRITPAAEKLLNVAPTDVGRPITAIKLSVDVPDLEQLILSVIDTMTVAERETRDEKGRWYSLRVRPYKTVDNRIDGVVLALVDIDALKQTQEETEAARKYAAGIVETMREPLVVLGADLLVISANRAFYNTFKVSAAETENRPIYEVGKRQWDIPELRKLLEEILPQHTELTDFEVTHDFSEIGRRTILLNALRMGGRPGGGGREMILLAMEDISERKQVEVELRKVQELSDALNEIDTVILSTLDFTEIVHAVGTAAVRALGCESSVIILRERGRWRIKYVSGLSGARAGVKLTDEEAKHLGLIKRTQRPLIVDDAMNDPRVSRRLMDKIGLRSFAAVPLIARERVFGVMAFHYQSAPTAFADVQIDFVGKVGASVSLALENSRLFAEEHNIAETLQEAILTMPDRIEGLDFGHLYASATVEAAKVGGDFYDLFELEDDKVGIVIGDVSGKGLSAAALTSQVKNAINAYSRLGEPPRVVLARTNSLLTKTVAFPVFVTAFFGILDKTSGKLTYCGAGHPPPILKQAKRVLPLITDSPILGIFADPPFLDHEATLKKGDVFLGYTDGVIEARRAKELFGEERLIELVKELQGVSAKELPQTVFDKVRAFGAGHLADDVALLTVALK